MPVPKVRSVRERPRQSGDPDRFLVSGSGSGKAVSIMNALRWREESWAVASGRLAAPRSIMNQLIPRRTMDGVAMTTGDRDEGCLMGRAVATVIVKKCFV